MTRSLLLLATAMSSLVPAVASGATVDVAVSPDPIVSAPITFLARASSDDLAVTATLRPHDSLPCADTYGEEPAGWSLFLGARPGERKTREVHAPGTWLLCSYARDAGKLVARSAATFSVRANAASLMVQTPPTVSRPHLVGVVISGFTDAPRTLRATWKDPEDGPCGPTYDADSGQTLALDVDGTVTGPFRRTAWPGTENEQVGRYTICAWLGPHGSNRPSDAAAGASFRIAPERPFLTPLDLSVTTFEAAPFGSAIQYTDFGTSLTLRSNVPATVRFHVRRHRAGRWVRVPGHFTVRVSTVTEHLTFSGRVGGRTLPRGRYRLYATARNESGTSTRRRGFRIVRPRRPGPGFD